MEQLNLPLQIKIGVDLVFMPRLEKHINNEAFLNKVLTEDELILYQEVTTNTRKLEFLCGRFACKEAFSKAYGTGIGKTSFKDFEILRNELGAPVSKQGQVSISHDGSYTIGQVLIYV